MATTPSQKTSIGGSSSSQRRRLAAEAAKKPRVVFPTLLQPDSEDSVPTMSIADSALLRATLVQSRHSWTHTAFTRFIPEPPGRGPGGKKFASELTPSGVCTVCIGPHMFLDTKFFSIYNPLPPPVVPSSTPSTAPNTGTTTPTSTDQVADSPAATPPPVVLGGSPAPERVIELIMARTANMAAEAAAAGAIPESLGLTPMDIDTNIGGSSSNSKPPVSLSMEPTQSPTTAASATKEEELTALAQIKTESQEKSIPTSQVSSPATPIAPSTKGKTLASRAQRPRHQVAFEFKENPNVRWLFPHETSLERTPPEGDVPGKISASFFLPTMEEARGGLAGTAPGAIPPLVPGPGQATTMVILQATTELWTGLTQSINDSAATYRFMMDKLKHIPPRHYVQYKLPVDFPDEQLHPMGLKKLPDNRVVPLTSLQPSKRKSELSAESQTTIAKAKKPKAGQEEPAVSKPPAPVKKTPAPAPAPTPVSAASTVSSSNQKKCSYCDSVSTPMWRRGPKGPGTLCNACGVKWKHGKILEDASEKATAVAKPIVTAPVVVTPPTISVVTPAPVSAALTGTSSLTTTAEAAARMHHGLSTGSNETVGPEVKAGSKKSVVGSRKKDSCASEDSSASDAVRSVEGDKGETKTGKKRSASKAGLSGSPGPKLVPINQLGEKQAGKSSTKKDKEKPKPRPKEKATKEKVKEKEKDKGKETVKEKGKDGDKDTTRSEDKMQEPATKAEKDQNKDGAKESFDEKDTEKDRSKAPDAKDGQLPAVKTEGSTQSRPSSPSSQETPTSISSSATASPTVPAPISSSASAMTKPVTTASAKATTAKSTTAKATSTKAAATPKTPKAKATAAAAVSTTTSATSPASAVKPTVSTATTAGAKLELLRSYAGAATKYQATHAPAVATTHLADDGLALYATKNLYTNNTATFPLHFPTISVAFGPNNAYYTYPNCAVVLFENHFQIKLIHGGERAEIDVDKEGIEGTEFQVIDVGDGESMIVMKALLRQHLSRFDRELLNPDKNENSMVFRFRERLDGGGPPVKPLLEQWLTTEIPVAGAGMKSGLKKP
ncbi:hypothetical protein EC957_004690 [Mortierella hygrophila]|uniref:GATA-type domain-containing protein n=1 Tax=Mortierella hygrophila TaxID=979708 RepID=A0A9P6F0B3_9FUNG|nr:hypothetical protein EC957_004690 [Mortierella hygrophila]